MEKGLKFIPIPQQVSKEALIQGGKQFARNIKFAHFFHNKTNRSNYSPKLFVPKSSWEPPDSYLPQDTKSELDKLDVLLNKIHIAKDTPNMSDLELKALFNLEDRDDVVFKKADKGNAIVIMDRDDYIREAHNQIFNDKYCKPLEGPVYLNTTDEVNSILDKLLLNGWLDNTQVEYLRPADNPRPRIFYTLSKIHKPMDKWLVPDKIPPGRPIVSDCSSDSYHISELIDHFIKPLSNRHPSYVKDTWDLLDKLQDIEVPSNAILVTADVQSLYTNIQPNKGLEALRKMYDKYDVCMPFEEINRLLELSLLHNEATSILFKVLREKQHYSGRFLRQVKTIFLRNYRQPGNTLDPIGAALKCKSSRCQCCLFLDEKSHFSNDDFDFSIFGGLNCLSKNIIYIIECKACGDKYVGETGRCLKDRVFNHISDIRRNINGPVSRHFNNTDTICFGAE